jgi:hypothetical protein
MRQGGSAVQGDDDLVFQNFHVKFAPRAGHRFLRRRGASSRYPLSERGLRITLAGGCSRRQRLRERCDIITDAFLQLEGTPLAAGNDDPRFTRSSISGLARSWVSSREGRPSWTPQRLPGLGGGRRSPNLSKRGCSLQLARSPEVLRDAAILSSSAKQNVRPRKTASRLRLARGVPKLAPCYCVRRPINPHTSRMSAAPTMLAMKPAP